MRPYYPAHFHLDGRLCVVVGGGAVALRRVTGLLAAGARVRLVSPEVVRGLLGRAEAGEIDLVRKPYSRQRLVGAALVFAATGSRPVNAQIARDSRAAGIPVNVADAVGLCDFIVPAVLRRGDLCVSVSTGSASPTLAASVRDDLERYFGPEYAQLVDLLHEMRDFVRSRMPAPEARVALKSLAEAADGLRAVLAEHGAAAAREQAHELLSRTDRGVR